MYLLKLLCNFLFSSVQLSHSVMSDSFRPHESQHTSPPCPSPTPGVTRAQLVKNALAMQETPVQFLGQEALLKKE